MPNIDKISQFLQDHLNSIGRDSVRAVEAAEWLDKAGLLNDSASRPGRPLRDLLRANKIKGQRQENNWHWLIDRI